MPRAKKLKKLESSSQGVKKASNAVQGLFDKWGVKGDGPFLEMINSPLVKNLGKKVGKKGSVTKSAYDIQADADRIQYFCNKILHPLLPENDSKLVVMNDMLCGEYSTKWHAKEKFVALARHCQVNLYFIRQAKVSDNHTFFEKPSTRAICQIVVPRISEGPTRDEYLILAHPLDAQVTLLAARQPHTVEVCRRMALDSGNMALMTQHFTTAPSIHPLCVVAEGNPDSPFPGWLYRTQTEFEELLPVMNPDLGQANAESQSEVKEESKA